MVAGVEGTVEAAMAAGVEGTEAAGTEAAGTEASVVVPTAGVEEEVTAAAAMVISHASLQESLYYARIFVFLLIKFVIFIGSLV